MKPRELQVLKLIAEGLVAKEIAAKLNLNYRTIEDYVSDLKEIFKAKNKAHLMVLAMRQGFIS